MGVAGNGRAFLFADATRPRDTPAMTSYERLLRDIRDCTLCAAHLPLGPRPILQADPAARLLIVGQAPGRKVHQTGIPFNDPSGDRLRQWLGVTQETFYDAKLLALVPMGFCYPGKGTGGDLPPRPECAEAWRARVLKGLPRVELTLVLGRYALDWHLKQHKGAALSETVSDWRQHLAAGIVPLPHPSPRNIRWFKANPWFEAELVPVLRKRVKAVLKT
jgi:uracil-DNA glycosylase